MRRGQPLGLDELMIVNPGSPGAAAIFLGEDGILYQAQGLGREEDLSGLGRFFLGEDGFVYQVQGFGLSEDGRPGIGSFFLGDDGRLYEIIR
jgi:hypothetical protein